MDPVTNAAWVADVVGAAVFCPAVVDVLVAVAVGVVVAVDVPVGVAVAVPDVVDAGVTCACDCVVERRGGRRRSRRRGGGVKQRLRLVGPGQRQGVAVVPEPQGDDSAGGQRRHGWRDRGLGARVDDERVVDGYRPGRRVDDGALHEGGLGGVGLVAGPGRRIGRRQLVRRGQPLRAQRVRRHDYRAVRVGGRRVRRGFGGEHVSRANGRRDDGKARDHGDHGQHGDRHGPEPGPAAAAGAGRRPRPLPGRKAAGPPDPARVLRSRPASSPKPKDPRSARALRTSRGALAARTRPGPCTRLGRRIRRRPILARLPVILAITTLVAVAVSRSVAVALAVAERLL